MLAGALSIHRLALEQYPDIAPTQVSVSATYTGASAKTIEDSDLPPSLVPTHG
jgi:multidrug efflux pump subunit AcrB